MDINAINSDLSNPTDHHPEIQALDVNISHLPEASTFHNITEFESKMWDEIKNMNLHIETVTQSLRELQARLDNIQQCAKNKSPGCGFSCSNNSFAL